MNVRIETGARIPAKTGETEVIHHDFKSGIIKKQMDSQNNDSYSEVNRLFRENEEKKYQTAEIDEYLKQGREEFKFPYDPDKENPPQNLNSGERIKMALDQFHLEQERQYQKQQEMSQDWSEFEQGNKIRLEKKTERAEKRSLSGSNSNFAEGTRMSAIELSGEAQKQKQEGSQLMWQQKESHPLLEQQLLRTQEALQEAHQERNEELVAILEEQERNLLNAVNKYRETAPSPVLSEDQKAMGLRNIETQKQYSENKKFNIPENLISDVDFVEIPDGSTSHSLNPGVEIKSPLSDLGPDDRTLDTLHRLHISYEELVEKIPDFGGMSEGQRAYILYKAEQQGIEHVQEQADSEFKAKMAEKKGFFGAVSKIFTSGRMRRDANRNAANAHVGLGSFQADIEDMVRHVKEGELEISINKQNNYRIEYAKAPSGISEKEQATVDNYNTAATMLSDIPYEWALPTATKQEKKEFDLAKKQFELHESKLMKMLDQGEEIHPELLSLTKEFRTKIELNQYFSANKDVAAKLEHMKTATVWTELTQKFWEPNKTKTGLLASAAGVAVKGGSKFISKAMWGLGGAALASGIVGGIMAYQRKDNEFKQDAKAARRGNKTKKTTNSTTLATRTVDKINNLVAKLQTLSPDDPKYTETQALLKTRLEFTNRQMKEGRVNFGSAKEQLKNKQDLLDAFVLGATIDFQTSNKYKALNERLNEFVGFGTKSKKRARQAQRTYAAFGGALAGATFGTTAYLIADWYRGGEASTRVLNTLREGVKDLGQVFGAMNPGISDTWTDGSAIRTSGFVPNLDDAKMTMPPPAPPAPTYNPTDFELSVDASSKGAIGMVSDLREEFGRRFPDMTKAPESVQEFMRESQNETKYSMEKGLFVPGQANESAIINGAKMGLNRAGEIIYTDPRTGVDIFSGGGKFDGEYFDSSRPSAGGVNNQPKVDKFAGQQFSQEDIKRMADPKGPWDLEKQPWMEGVGENRVRVSDNPMYPGQGENIFAESGGAESLAAEQIDSPTGARNVEINDKLKVSYDVVKNPNGSLKIEFPNVILNNFDAYHNQYLTTDWQSYVQRLITETNFLEANGSKYTPEVVQNDFHLYVNQFILRDQILQEGGLDSASQEYKILQKERDALKEILDTRFNIGDEKPLKDFAGKKYPDPKFVYDVGSASAPEAEIGNVPEVPKSAVTNTFEVTPQDTEAAKGIKVSVTKNEEGVITDLKLMKASVNPAKVSLQEFGYNPNWLSESGLSQTFRESGEGEKLLKDINLIKADVAVRETFSKGSGEYNYLDNRIKEKIAIIESKYPSVFN